MQRDYLICSLVGYFVANDNNIQAKDLRIKIDETLAESCLTPLGGEPHDEQLLNELVGEMMIRVMGAGINRKQRRKRWITKTG